MKRAQHSSHVAQRRGLDAPLAHGPLRLTLEVDDHEVLACEQHLPQVEIAVATDPPRIDAVAQEFAKQRENGMLLIQYKSRLQLGFILHVVKLRFKKLKRRA